MSIPVGLSPSFFYHVTRRNIPEERQSQLHCGESVKSRPVGAVKHIECDFLSAGGVSGGALTSQA